MVRSFKFLQNNQEDFTESILAEDERSGASWIYGRIENLDQYEYDILTEYSYGIHPFLNQFPDGFIVTILSITGPNGRIHNDVAQYEDGWGFDILNDLMTIEWVRFRYGN